METFEWTFLMPCRAPNEILQMMLPDEEVVCAYQTVRDCAVFTSKRMIVRDVHGTTGKKVEVFTLPYSSIIQYSLTSAGYTEISAQVCLWTLAGKIIIDLGRGINARDFDFALSSAILD